MTLRRIDSFDTANPEKLADQLSRLEDNIDRALALLDSRLSFGDWVLVGPIQLAYDRVARFNTNAVTVDQGAALPSVSVGAAGKLVGLKKEGARNIVVSPIESTALIDGSPSYTITTDGLYLFMQDGETWSLV